LIRGDRRVYQGIKDISNRMGNEIKGITRAGLVLAGELGSQDDWNSLKDMEITKKGLEILREADSIAMNNLEKFNFYNKISQMPVVLFPGPKKPWVCLRPVVTPDLMTLRTPKIPDEISWEYLDKTAKEIMELGSVGGVILDTTNKPPATTEWE